jgi:hypothetical protein
MKEDGSGNFQDVKGFGVKKRQKLADISYFHKNKDLQNYVSVRLNHQGYLYIIRLNYQFSTNDNYSSRNTSRATFINF